MSKQLLINQCESIENAAIEVMPLKSVFTVEVVSVVTQSKSVEATVDTISQPSGSIVEFEPDESAVIISQPIPIETTSPQPSCSQQPSLI